jgi:hypothetical protein
MNHEIVGVVMGGTNAVLCVELDTKDKIDASITVLTSIEGQEIDGRYALSFIGTVYDGSKVVVVAELL